MTPERFRQIEELYHAAREGTPEERSALLARTDPGLRREVEALLSQEEPAGESTMTMVTVGMQLGRYVIEAPLGKGGMGEVFRARDTRLGRSVAIKVSSDQFTDRFEREARAISALNHPHICTLYDVGPNYLVMELVEGETIATRLKNGPLPLKTTLQNASQIVAALVEAHGKGIIHRDLKPGNIMLAKSGVKVLDFGLAKSGQDENLTASRVVMGTPAYMAPEQREGKPADARSDIYSFGCVLHEMATGARASSQRKRIPSAQLERIVNRCLEEDPERRWQSAAELERELAGVTATGNRWKLMVAAAAAVLVLSTGAYFYLHRAPALTDKDTIVLADFINTTGDPVFDGTLRQGLAIQLEQSPFLKIMDDNQVRGVVGRMSLAPGARVTNQVAREVCVREGAAATIDGTIASIGSNYVITLQATTCQDGATLAREQLQAEDKEHVLKAVGTAATAMRGKLGESLDSIQKLNRPLEEATTASLEALQSYTAGYTEMVQGHSLAAVPLFERAVAIDPNFAMAYQFLGVAFGAAGDEAKEGEYIRKAFGLIDHVSEYERAQITPYYYRITTGEFDKVIDAFRLAIRNYPRYWGFHSNLGDIYIRLGRYEEGLKEGLEAARLQANIEPPYRRQLDAYICLDRLREAKEVAQKVRALGIDGSRIHQRFLEMAYVEDDQAAISKEIQWFAGKPEEYLSFALQAANSNVHGKRRESHKLFERAGEAALRQKLPSLASEFEDVDALADALSGRCQTARHLGRPALALGLCGDAAQAEKLAAETSKLFPNGTIWNAVQLPGIRAAIALHRDQPASSVELLESASPYERSYIEAVYLRGIAYLRLRKGAEAVAEFRKIVDHKGASWGATWVRPYWGQFYSLSYLDLARASVLAGDAATARKAFDDFFTLWKDADQDVPVLTEARKEYAALK